MPPSQEHNLVMGLDIGTNKIAATVGHVAEGGVEILGMAKVANTGLRRGQIVDVEETISSISAILEEVERSARIPVNSAIVGISGAHIETTNSKGVIAVSRPDGEITQSDIDRVLEAARAVAIPANREIIHVLPKAFTVDSEEGIVDPLGMTGIRLEAEAHIVSCASPAIRNLVRAISQAGIKLDDMVFSPLATASVILTKRQKESGAVLIDIGAGTTSMVVYEEGDLVYAKVLPIGSMHITNDIAIGLKTSIDLAEAVKLRYGTAIKETYKEADTLDLTVLDSNELERPKGRYVAEIVEARLNELFMMVKKELVKIGKDGTLPAGAVFTGGGSQVEGLLEMARNTLHLPARMGQPAQEFAGSVDKIDDPTYATSVGLVLWGLEHRTHAEVKPHLKFALGSMEGVVEKTRDFFKQLLP